MPKLVDHDARRAEMARAVLRIAAREGMGAVSIGAVARELSVSKSLVQHYFTEKAQLLALAAKTLRLDLQQHIAAAVAGTGVPREQLRQILLALVGLGRQDPPTLLLAGHAFLASAGADPALRELYRAGGAAAERAVVGLLEAAGCAPGAAAFEARVLLALAAGLADATYIGQLDQRTAADTVEMHLARVIPGDGARP
jgi:AcrR family transcriptional regulator